MNNELVVKKSITVKVEPEKVCRALTDRETIKKYFFGTETTVHLTQEGFTNDEARSHGEGGWTMVLENLKKLLETE